MRVLAGILTLVAFVALVGASSFALRGWLRSEPEGGADAAPAFKDEKPLEVGHLTGDALHRSEMQAYPWHDLERQREMLRMQLPPDPATPSGHDRENRNNLRMMDAKITTTSKRMEWRQLRLFLMAALEPQGIQVYTHEPEPQEAISVQFQAGTFGANDVAYEILRQGGHNLAVAMTERGLCLSTEVGTSLAMRDVQVDRARRSVAHEHAAPVLDALWRPNFEEAAIDKVAKDMTAQTGVVVVADVRLWEYRVALTWRGEPRKLRDALDTLCAQLGAFWRFDEGKVFILTPQ